MCITPNFIWVERGPKWEQLPVACRQCWRCKKNRVNDYVARSMCEASTSEHVCCITLTYAPRDDLADKVLHPSHFQLFMKLLRRAGHKVRYLVVGEYGDLKGRAHFHAILFFENLLPVGPVVDPDTGEVFYVPSYNPMHLFNPQTSVPFCREIPSKRNVHIRQWPHGHVRVDWTRSEKAARYVCKYLLADNKNNVWFSLSKKPALGAAYFAKRAETARQYDVLPYTFEYIPPNGDRNKSYLITGASRRDYLNAITQDSVCKGRMSEWVLKSFEKYERGRAKDLLEGMTPEELEVAFLVAFERNQEYLRLDRYLAALQRNKDMLL